MFDLIRISHLKYGDDGRLDNSKLYMAASDDSNLIDGPNDILIRVSI